MNKNRIFTSSFELEKGAIRKSWNQNLRVALVYPNTYAVGMANLGFQTVYSLFNAQSGVVCERVFLPMEAASAKTVLVSWETRRRISDFDILAFSISFEDDFIHLPTILDLARIPLIAATRRNEHPLVMAGGVACFLNPEPIADFIDCFLLGEAEVLVPACLEVCRRYQTRQARLEALALEVRGAYVPQFYHAPAVGEEPAAPVIPKHPGVPATVACVYDDDFSSRPVPPAVVSPHAALGAVYLVETGRGCPHGCRFCSAGFVYRPPRFKSLDVLEAGLVYAAGRSRHIGLVGTAIAELPGIEALCRQAGEQKLRLSFSSLRADALTPALLTAMTRSRVKTATIAPDAGSERLRRVINKGLDQNTLMLAAERLVAGGIPNLRLYFMIGLPTETMDDIQALIDLVRLFKKEFLAASRPKGRIGTITVSINPFVPKPATPFQWAAMDSPQQLNHKYDQIKQALYREPNVRLRLENVRGALRQALLARGDRRMADLLVTLHRNLLLKHHLKELEEALRARYVHRQRPLDEPLAWEIVAHRVKKLYLQKEYIQSERALPTSDCVLGACGICGACTPEM